jgi:hypothetical protein
MDRAGKGFSLDELHSEQKNLPPEARKVWTEIDELKSECKADFKGEKVVVSAISVK